MYIPIAARGGRPAAGGARHSSGAGIAMPVEPEQVLFAGERVLWAGRPQRARRSWQEIGLALYVLVLTPIILVVTVASAVKHPLPLSMVVFGATVLVAGAFQSVGYLVYLLVTLPSVRAGARYAVTDRRVIVTLGSRSRRARSVYVDALPPVSVKDHADGTKTLRFGGVQREGLRAFKPNPYRREASAPAFSSLSAADAAAARAAVDSARSARPLSAPTGVAVDEPAGRAVPAGWSAQPGEQVLWVGRPGRVRWWYGTSDLGLSLFGIVWLIAVGSMEALAISQRAWPGVVFLVVFVVFGVHSVIGRVLWRRARVRRSAYLVTTHQVVTVWNLRGPRVVSAPLSRVLPPALSAEGTLEFTAVDPGPALRRQSVGGFHSLLSPAATGEPPVFLDLADARQAYELIGSVQATARSTRLPA